MTTYYPTSDTGDGPFVVMQSGDTTIVRSGISLAVVDGYDPCIEDDKDGTVEVDGSLTSTGQETVELGAAFPAGKVSTVTVGTVGVVSDTAINGYAIRVFDAYTIVNSGDVRQIGSDENAAGCIEAIGSGIIYNYGVIQADAYVGITAGGVIRNYGAISAPVFGIECNGQRSEIYNYGSVTGATSIQAGGIDAIINLGTLSGDVELGETGSRLINKATVIGDVVSVEGAGVLVQNTGTITGSVLLGSGSGSRLDNAGTITGNVALGGGGQVVDSSRGQVDGIISAGNGGATIVAGTNGGTVEGGLGDDVLIANQTAAAAQARVHVTLDGRDGDNALYGGGAFNTFIVGDSDGGRNQVHGGASQMAGVAGTTNNTLDFEYLPPAKSVFVDLLHGHDAFVNSNASNTGTDTLEDSIRNVPNVIGSAGDDIIVADNGTDVIQGGAGADRLHAGTGFDTFVYSGYADSTLAGGRDTISGFRTGTDKIDLSALHSNAGHLLIQSGTTSTALYLEAVPGHVNASTDLAIGFAGAHAVTAGDVIF